MFDLSSMLQVVQFILQCVVKGMCEHGRCYNTVDARRSRFFTKNHQQVTMVQALKPKHEDWKASSIPLSSIRWNKRWEVCLEPPWLHWLPVRYRVQFKTGLITYKILNQGQPVYLRELIHPYTSSRNTR